MKKLSLILCVVLLIASNTSGFTRLDSLLYQKINTERVKIGKRTVVLDDRFYGRVLNHNKNIAYLWVGDESSTQVSINGINMVSRNIGCVGHDEFKSNVDSIKCYPHNVRYGTTIVKEIMTVYPVYDINKSNLQGYVNSIYNNFHKSTPHNISMLGLDSNDKNNNTCVSTYFKTVNDGDGKFIYYLLYCTIIYYNADDINKQDANGYTKLFYATRIGDTSLVKHLISRGADVNKKDNIGNTPLYISVIKNDVSMVSFLIKNGASVNSIDRTGRPPLYVSVDKGNIIMSDVLIGYGANVNVQDIVGRTAVLNAVSKGLYDMTKYLIGQGADINISELCGNTPLMIASEKGDVDMVRLIIDNGADITARNNRNKTASQLATSNKVKDMLSTIKK